MVRIYAPLPASGLKPGASFHQPPHPEAKRVGMGDSAVEVMTDFKQVRALTVYANATMDCAHQRMTTHNVHLLLVVDGNNALLGLITSTDILGAKPLRLIQERRIARSEIIVSDVMTPLDRLEVLDMDKVLPAKVGHVVATLKAMGRQHAMIVDRDERGRQKVRGLFSVSQLAKQLGMAIHTTEIARNFAQVEEMLAQ